MNSLRASTVFFLAASCIGGLSACSDDDNDNKSGDPATGESSDVTLNFAAKVGGEDFVCGQTYGNLGIASDENGRMLKVLDYRVFVSDISLTKADGSKTAVELTQDGVWQYENLALLDFENSCKDSGTPELNTAVRGTVPAGDYTGICLTVGVPFELNHLDNTTAPSPLNASGMFWNWQGGYKFIRVDGMVDPGDSTHLNTGYNLHLGSTGCDSADKVSSPAERCEQPNLVEVCFDGDSGFDLASDVVSFDVAPVLAESDLTADVDAPPGCMAFPEDNACREILPLLGLDYVFNSEDVTPAKTQQFVSKSSAN
ncbi:MAG: metallo-mystery pair system four-Cys motif protein [Gammaproteobacteria bacterium]|nr:metallo-mystery pair system four-Cys motif protein [Gammaproteobacteria bacterium]